MAKPLTVRDIRLHWPEAERRLKKEREIIITRDGEPVAKLTANEPEAQRRPSWSPKRHLEWLGKTWKDAKRAPSTDELLARDRER